MAFDDETLENKNNARVSISANCNFIDENRQRHVNLDLMASKLRLSDADDTLL